VGPESAALAGDLERVVLIPFTLRAIAGHVEISMTAKHFG
jgi:hypothetical protein